MKAGPVPGLIGCINLLLSAAVGAFAGLQGVLCLSAVWAVYASYRGLSVWQEFFQRLRWLRWFLLALLLLHGGSALSAPPMVRMELALQALQQMLVLLLLLLAVSAVLGPLDVQARIQAFSHLLAPFRSLGWEPERIGRMLALALSEAMEQRAAWAQAGASGGGVQGVVDRVATACLRIEEQTPAMPPKLEDSQRSPVWYWFLPTPLLIFLLWSLLHG